MTIATLTLALNAPVGAASDKALARTGVIVAKDLPSSWESTPADPDADQNLESLAAGFPECADYLDSRAQMKQATNATSRDFASPDGGNVSNETWVFPRTAQARRAFSAMGGSTIPGCLTSLFQTAIRQQLDANPSTAGKVASATTTIRPITSLPSGGDDQLGYAGIVSVTLTDGTAEQVFIAYFGIRTARGILGYTVAAATDTSGTLNRSFSKPTEKAINTSAKRMETALTG